MKSIQISFDEHLLETIDRIAAESRITRSAIVREAVKVWLKQKKIQEFEDQWIQQLAEKPEEVQESEAWMNVEQWSET
jgi:metal-responsive CopG/Arc/MetJ family transcriptional regulator